DADFAVEFDVVEIGFCRLEFQRVGRLLIVQVGMVWLAEVGVVVDGDLAVDREDFAARGGDERVDLNEGRVFLPVHVPKLLNRVRALRGEFGGEAGGGDDLVGLGLIDADVRVDGDLRERLGALDRELLDVHSAFYGGHR